MSTENRKSGATTSQPLNACLPPCLNTTAMENRVTDEALPTENDTDLESWPTTEATEQSEVSNEEVVGISPSPGSKDINLRQGETKPTVAPLSPEEEIELEAVKKTKRHKSILVTLAVMGIVFHIIWGAAHVFIGELVIRGEAFVGDGIAILSFGCILTLLLVPLNVLLLNGAINEDMTKLSSFLFSSTILNVAVIVCDITVALRVPYLLGTFSLAEGHKIIWYAAMLPGVFVLLLAYCFVWADVLYFKTWLKKLAKIRQAATLARGRKKKIRIRAPGIVYTKKQGKSSLTAMGMKIL